MGKAKILTSSIIFLLVTLLCVSAGKNVVDAAVKDDTGTSSWNPTTSEVSDMYGMEYQKVIGSATTSNVTSNQHLSVFNMKTDGVNSKLVNWAMQTTADSYSRVGLSHIAADYEKKHPGWIVLGGINADQYYTSYGSGRGTNGTFYYTPQPYYPAIMDGERRFAYSPYGASGNMVGFTNDGSANSLVYDTTIKGFYIYIMDNNNEVISKFPVDKFNEALSSNGTNVWSPYFSSSSNFLQTVVAESTTGDSNIYIVENAELSHMSNTKAYGSVNEGYVDAFFGKGIISKISSGDTIGRYQFAIQTGNASVKAALAVGKKVVVQAEYVNEAMNKVESGAGFHSIQRQNGIDVTDPAIAKNTYNARQYNRSIFGRRADGSYVLITAEKSSGASGYAGLNFTETNAVLKHYGVVDGYQDDGGGSVTAIVRNSKGSFDIVNESSDSGVTQRSIFNGLFFVVRDPGIKADNITRHSFDIVTTETHFSSMVSNIEIEFGAKKQSLTNAGLSFSDLDESTNYSVKVSYKLTVDGKSVNVSYSMMVRTKDFEMPPSGLRVASFTDTTIKIVKDSGEMSSWIKNVRIYVDDTRHNMRNNTDEYEITGLTKGGTYTIRFEYQVTEPGNDTIYEGIDKEIKVYMLPFTMPTIDKFEKLEIDGNKIVFDFKYSDPETAITKAYLYVNNEEKIEVTSTSGTVSYDSYYIDTNSYKFELVLEYHHRGTVYQIRSDSLDYAKTTPKASGCTGFSTVLFSITVCTSLAVVIVKRKT